MKQRPVRMSLLAHGSWGGLAIPSVQVNTHAYVCMCTGCLGTHMCTCVCMHVPMHLCMCSFMCMHVCVSVCVLTCPRIRPFSAICVSLYSDPGMPGFVQGGVVG